MFETVLVGYDNPLGHFPAPLVPILSFGGKLYAVYVEINDNTKHTWDFRTGKYFPIPDEVAKDFDWLTENLFGIDENSIQRFDADSQKSYFIWLLRNPEFAKDKPFVRLSLAIPLKDERILQREMENCIKQNDPAIVKKAFEAMGLPSLA